MTTTWRFEVVKHLAVKTFRCPTCGRPGRRQRTFRQTINPFNKNADGQVKTRAEIMVELKVQAAEWERTPTLHEGCEL